MKNLLFKKKAISLFMLCLLGCMSIFTGCQKEDINKIIEISDVSQSTWLWESTKISSINTIKQSKILGLDEIYVNTGWEEKTKEFYLEKHPIMYATFIETANDQKIKVQALLSNPDWALSSNYSNFESQVKTILNYNKKYNYTFSAIHLDIEPHLLKDWDNNIEKYLTSYLDNLKKIKALIDNHNTKNKDSLRLALDIPFWFNGEQYTVKGENIIDLLLEYADELNIMTYTQNQAYFVEWGNNILSIADKHQNKSIKIAIEVQPEEKDVTLYELNSDEIIKYLKDSLDEFEKHDSFKGIAIHDYSSYIDYVKKEVIK